MLGESLDGKVVTIVGAGRIGRETARLVEAFGEAGSSTLGRADPLLPLWHRPTSSACTARSPRRRTI